MKPCPLPCEARAELYARVMEGRDLLEALLIRRERWEWADDRLVARVRAYLSYEGS